MTIDQTVVLAIMGIAGIGVLGFTQMIKQWLKASGIAAKAISLAVSAGATAFVLIQSATFSWVAFAVYTIVVFLEANGLYRAKQKPA